VIDLAPDRIAAALGAEILARGAGGRPERAAIDSREVARGDLFFGLRGERRDGGEYAPAAIAEGAWGVVVTPERARTLVAAGETGGAWVFAAAEPLAALQALARAWRRALGCRVAGITGSTGKTSVKDICRAILPARVQASPENYNTEIGLPLAVLAAPPETELLVLEMAMRGKGQIAELCRIAEPDVGAITNIGPVHLELLGSVEAIAEAKAEILHGLGEGGRAVVPADEEALAPHLHDRLVTLTFGPGGDVFAPGVEGVGERIRARIETPHGGADFAFPFGEAHNLRNALCAVAIGVALGAPVEEMARRAPRIAFSRLRGERIELPGGILVINDCYNANPVSMRAALEHLAATAGSRRRLAVLGEMKELGAAAAQLHREAGAEARRLGVDALVGVGELARDYAPDAWAPDADAAVATVDALLEPGDVVLVKGSRAVELERLTDALLARRSSR